MRKYLQCLAIIGMIAGYAYSEEPATDSASAASKNMMKTLEHIMAKAGISFDGEFQSRFGAAAVGGNAVDNSKRTNETVEFTQVDFDIKARPNTVTQGRLIFRMQQDWRNFYSDISNPIFTRWISIDGSVFQGMFSYDVGDFRQKYSPLTLYTPDIDVLYEPDLFADQRTIAKNEVFLDDNQRLLQGVNLNFAAELYPVLNSLKVNVLGSRLRGVETSIQNGSKVVSYIEVSPIEKFMAAGNVDMTFLKGLSVGGSYLNVFDNKESYNGPGGDSAVDTMAQNTRIGAVRAGADIASVLEAKNWKLGLSMEWAFSNDDSVHYDTARSVKLKDTNVITGNALRLALKVGYSLENVFSCALDAGFINNTSNFRNELAQTPDFYGRRIMDFENDNSSIPKFSVTLPLYSTFDAMYQQVFKFAPSPQDKFNGNQTWWYKEPFSKNSYTPVVFTQSELAQSRSIDTSRYFGHNYLKGQYLDPSVQLVMPFGPATPNRTGINGNATLGFLGDRIQAKVLFASLKEIDTTVVLGATPTSPAKTLPKTSYSQMGGGVKADLSSFVGWQYPIKLSSSVVVSKASNDGISGDSLYPAASITSTFYSENVYFKFWKRLAFLGGMEYINNQFETYYLTTQNQLLTAIGLEYKLTDGSYVTGMIGQIDVMNTSTNPDYLETIISAGKSIANPNAASRRNFNQNLVSLFLRVMF